MAYDTLNYVTMSLPLSVPTSRSMLLEIENILDLRFSYSFLMHLYFHETIMSTDNSMVFLYNLSDWQLVFNLLMLSVIFLCYEMESSRWIIFSDSCVFLLQMERVLAAYRKSSKQWSSTINKLAQGMKAEAYPIFLFLSSAVMFVLQWYVILTLFAVRQRGRKRTMVG